MAAPNTTIKRLVICCDGTWMDSDDGIRKPTLIPYRPTASVQIPSNVTRISRALRKHGLDGVPQIIFYHSGVGTSSTKVDMVTGGLLGVGISENIREVYSFIAANYTPGDEIVLIGFSRGAFTVRCVASMISVIGLLTREGMENFYPIFKDYQNFKNDKYYDFFPDIPFSDKPKGPDAARLYRQRLEKNGFTRHYDPDGSKIKTHAVAVWDTVGALGIPNISLLAKFGLPHCTIEYKFFDTNLSGNIRHAFQALALDERRAPFKAAVWEREDRHRTTVDLRQVWFPGAHSNVGGGYDDQEIANISLAWMMDQLASINVSFQDEYIDKIFIQNVRYYEDHPKQQSKLGSLRYRERQWARDDIYEKHKPVRPWGLGKIWDSKTSLWTLAGTGLRTPGLNMRADPETGTPTRIPMQDTNERIHSCVRIRLDLDGLGLDDKGLYKPHALDKKWRPRQVALDVRDPIPWDATWGPGAPRPEGSGPNQVRWVWEYIGPEDEAPVERYMVEETLGPYERKLLLLNKGRKYYKRFRRRRRRSRRTDDLYDHSQFTIDGDQSDEKFRRRHSTVPSSGLRSSTIRSDVRSSQVQSDGRGDLDRDRRRYSLPVVVNLGSEDDLIETRARNVRPRPRERRGTSAEKTRPRRVVASESEESLMDEREVRRVLLLRERAANFPVGPPPSPPPAPRYRDVPPGFPEAYLTQRGTKSGV
ncbi:hypothetical protein LZ554_006247 [Drepanopeziza brunnea f. sp. 'monogermtubi']|nr:hypothetical protein LZ554_006247 [Drepanopeziza brunnea f. sp. 'monogermtubi']